MNRMLEWTLCGLFYRSFLWESIFCAFFGKGVGQPCMRKSGRCFVAIVDIEADGLTSCFNRGGRSPTKGNSGKTVHWRRAGNKQSPDILSLLICVSRFAANMDVSRETLLLTKFNGNGEISPIKKAWAATISILMIHPIKTSSLPHFLSRSPNHWQIIKQFYQSLILNFPLLHLLSKDNDLQ